MTRVFLIRHGEPAAGFGEADDPGLTETGRAQADAAARALARLGPLKIVSSPMQRCRETAAPFGALSSVDISIDVRVSEVATPPGVADRMDWLRQTFPWRENAVGTIWPALPPLLWAWRADVLAALTDRREDCAVFTHFIAINAIVGAALGRAETIVCRPDHASVTEMRIEDGVLKLIELGAEMKAGEVR